MPLVGFLRSTSLANATPRERIPEVLRQLVPKATTIVVLVPPNTTETEAERRDVHCLLQGSALAQQAVKRVTPVDYATGDVLGVLFVHDLQRGDQPALAALRLLGGERDHDVDEGAAQVPVRHVFRTDSVKMVERAEQARSHAGAAVLDHGGRVGQLLKGVPAHRPLPAPALGSQI
jgi:hypothetical protein